MAIAPIDLQTMYSQASNVSKVLNTAQQVQLTENMQQQNNINKNLENTKKVQKASEDNNPLVNKDGHNSNQQNQGSSFEGSKKENLADDNNPYPSNNKKSFMGTIIDIKR